MQGSVTQCIHPGNAGYKDWRTKTEIAAARTRYVRDLLATLSAVELNEFKSLRAKRTHLERYDWFDPDSKWNSAAEFKQLVEKLKKSKRRPPHPPVINPDPNDRLSKLRIEVRVLERKKAEDLDVLASVDALLHLAEMAAAREAEEQRQKEEARRQQAYAQAGPMLDILNLKHNATTDQIKARYRSLLKRLHPDTNRGDEAASGLLRRVVDAYRQLETMGRV